MQKNRYTDLDDILKTYFEEQGYEYGTLDNFKSKTLPLYHKIEQLLELAIEEEFEQ